MGWDIYIGEWRARASADDEPIDHIEDGDAPAFNGDDAGRTNRRQPSYVEWDQFCVATGLKALFHGENGLFAEHPGTVQLTKKHAQEIHRALGRYTLKYPNAESTFLGGERDKNLARLEWLVWWVDWALTNCKRPAIHNR